MFSGVVRRIIRGAALLTQIEGDVIESLRLLNGRTVACMLT